MKKLLILAIAFLLTSSALFSQDAVDRIKTLVKEKNFEEAGKLVEQAIAQDSKNRDLLILCGDVYYELNNLDAAISTYDKALQLKSSDWEVMVKISNAYAEKNNNKKALDYLDKAFTKLKENSKDYNKVKLQYANILIKMDSLKPAELIITQVKANNPNSAEAYVMLGNLYLARKIYALAENNYVQALDIEPKNTMARANLAESYYWLGNIESDTTLKNEYYSRCVKEFNKVSTEDPLNAKAWLRQGKIFFASEQFANAAKAMYQYIKLRPSDWQGRWILGKSMYKIGLCDSAKINLELVAKNIDTLANEANVMLAKCYYSNKNYDKSIEEFNKVNPISYLTIRDRQFIGNAYLQLNDTLKCLETWTKLAIDSANFDNRCNLLNYAIGLYSKMKMRTKAIETANIVLSSTSCSRSDSAKAYYAIGSNYIFMATEKDVTPENKLNFSLKTIEYLKPANSLEPTNIYTILYLGDAYINIDSLVTGISYYQKAITEAKKDASTDKQLIASYNKICGLYLNKKDYKELKKFATEWTVDQANVEWGWFYLALANHSLGEFDAAIKNYKKTLTINPNNAVAKKNLNKLLNSQNE